MPWMVCSRTTQEQLSRSSEAVLPRNLVAQKPAWTQDYPAGQNDTVYEVNPQALHS